MTCGFLLQLVFCKKKKKKERKKEKRKKKEKKKEKLHQSVTPFLSGAAPPKKNPGSAPEETKYDCFR